MAADKEYIERGALLLKIDIHGTNKFGMLDEDVREFVKSIPAAYVVSKGVFEQVKWERDMAMKQLDEHGIPFGGKADDVVKVVRCKDCRFYGNEERHPYGGECEWFGALVERNNFCFYGERKEQT